MGRTSVTYVMDINEILAQKSLATRSQKVALNVVGYKVTEGSSQCHWLQGHRRYLSMSLATRSQKVALNAIGVKVVVEVTEC